MTVLLLPRRPTPREIAEARADCTADADLFLRWFEEGRRDAAANADLEMVWRALRTSDVPAAALAGWLEGVAAHRAQVTAERRLRAVTL